MQRDYMYINIIFHDSCVMQFYNEHGNIMTSRDQTIKDVVSLSCHHHLVTIKFYIIINEKGYK